MPCWRQRGIGTIVKSAGDMIQKNIGLLGVVFQPVGAQFVGKVCDFEVGECCFEALAVRASCKHSDFYGMIGLNPGIAHHMIFLADWQGQWS